MFEHALVESSGSIHTRSKYYTLLGALFNGILLAAMVLLPLLYPEALPKNAMTAMLVAPPPPPAMPPASPVVRGRPVRMAAELSEFTAPSRIPQQISLGQDTSEPPMDASAGMQRMGESAGPPQGLADLIGGGMPTIVRAPAPKRVIISQGVMAGNIVSKPEPAYPAIAKAARIQGTVILSATISKTGTIENLSIVSGPAMLAQAALEAVRNWRYRPYLLNGQPVEVQTLVNVTFTLGG